MRSTIPLLLESDFPSINRRELETLQVNLGYKCNQSCVHCHVNAGPNRTEMMDRATVELVLKVLEARRCRTLDLTGGAPELNPYFRELVCEARQLEVNVIDRCNLTILSEANQEDLPEFFARHAVEITASLPCYSHANVDRQRGKGVFDRSISGLLRLNELGYGHEASGLTLNLVYNPQGAVLPPAQDSLEADYKYELLEHFGVRFNRLYVITNMPIHRFGSMLMSKGEYSAYIKLLKNAYRSENLQTVMCRNMLSVDWMGYLYDCDFNQMLALPAGFDQQKRPHLKDLLGVDPPIGAITVADHCYGCTAGQGSSCGGALEPDTSDPTQHPVAKVAKADPAALRMLTQSLS
jgi:radical SAM/Cys-rich protein